MQLEELMQVLQQGSQGLFQPGMTAGGPAPPTDGMSGALGGMLQGLNLSGAPVGAGATAGGGFEAAKQGLGQSLGQPGGDPAAEAPASAAIASGQIDPANPLGGPVDPGMRPPAEGANEFGAPSQPEQSATQALTGIAPPNQRQKMKLEDEAKIAGF